MASSGGSRLALAAASTLKCLLLRGTIGARMLVA
jgi:hypothetical protein